MKENARIVLDRPQLELVESAEKPSGEGEPKEPKEKKPPEEEASSAADDEGGFALEVRQILISDGTLVMKKKGQDGETCVGSHSY